ncbi:hypothetical protein BDW74DRAFT_146469 [Aspergillus multicolor]|uniref:uncharacterized protein n=1 Tax=Aspergillus multicolor TaxID=41759 RepID=UPI003CCCF9E1
MSYLLKRYFPLVLSGWIEMHDVFFDSFFSFQQLGSFLLLFLCCSVWHIVKQDILSTRDLIALPRRSGPSKTMLMATKMIEIAPQRKESAFKLLPSRATRIPSQTAPH